MCWSRMNYFIFSYCPFSLYAWLSYNSLYIFFFHFCFPLEWSFSLHGLVYFKFKFCYHLVLSCRLPARLSADSYRLLRDSLCRQQSRQISDRGEPPSQKRYIVITFVFCVAYNRSIYLRLSTSICLSICPMSVCLIYLLMHILLVFPLKNIWLYFCFVIKSLESSSWFSSILLSI